MLGIGLIWQSCSLKCAGYLSASQSSKKIKSERIRQKGNYRRIRDLMEIFCFGNKMSKRDMLHHSTHNCLHVFTNKKARKGDIVICIKIVRMPHMHPSSFKQV